MSSYTKYKTKIIENARWLSDHGYFGALRGTGGNVSMRVDGEDSFVITPSSLPYDQLSTGAMCVLDFNLNSIEGEKKPSLESGMHLEVYKQRADVNAVIHSHQTNASVFAVLNQPLPPLFDEVCLHIGYIVDVVPYAFSGSPQLTANLVEKLSNKCHCYLLQNHGILTLGSTLEQALLNVELLEKNAQIYLGALSTGREPTSLPEETINKLKEIRTEAFLDR